MFDGDPGSLMMMKTPVHTSTRQQPRLEHLHRGRSRCVRTCGNNAPAFHAGQRRTSPLPRAGGDRLRPDAVRRQPLPAEIHTNMPRFRIQSAAPRGDDGRNLAPQRRQQSGDGVACRAYHAGPRGNPYHAVIQSAASFRFRSPLRTPQPWSIRPCQPAAPWTEYIPIIPRATRPPLGGWSGGTISAPRKVANNNKKFGKFLR